MAIRRKVSHHNKIQEKISTSLSSVGVGDIIEFKYSGRDIYDSKPMIFILEKQNKIKTNKEGNLTIPKNISKDLIDKYSQLESKIIGKKSKFEELRQMSDELVKDVGNKEKRLKTLNKAIEQANEIKPDIVKLKEELKSVGSELGLKKTSLSDMIVQEEIIKERLDGVQKAYDEKIKPFEKELEKVKTKQASLRKEYKEEIDKLEGEVAEIVAQFGKKKNELKGYEGQVKAAKSLLLDEFDKIKTATDELKQLERERAIVVREIADRKKRYEGWTIKEMDKVAKKVIKNKLEDIDKAGLRDITSAI